MTRLILRMLNVPALLLIVALGAAIQSSFFASHPLIYVQPDIVLLAVIWCGLKREFLEGGILTLLFANIAEIHSAAPRGLFLTSYMAIFLGIHAISRMVVIPNMVSLIKITIFTTAAWKLITLLILAFLDKAQNQWRHTLIMLLPGSAIEGALGIWVFRWLDRLDTVTFKSAHARQALEDELQLEREGI